MRECLFAYTPSEPVYPPYINISAVDGKVVVTMRGKVRKSGTIVEHRNLIAKDGEDIVLVYDTCGHCVDIELPLEEVANLISGLTAAAQR